MKQTTDKRHRGVEPSQEMAAAVRDLVKRLGSRSASRVLTLTRETTLALAASAAVDRGTIALARQRLAELDRAAEGEGPAIGDGHGR